MVDIIARAMAASAAKKGGESAETKIDLLKELDKISLDDITDDDITAGLLEKMSKVLALEINGDNYFLYENNGQSFIAINFDDDYKADILYGTVGSFNRVENIYASDEDLQKIEELIPNQASTTNQLADKAFVNSSVQTATANFRGNWSDWNEVPTDTSLYPEDYAGSKIPTENDYMVVQEAKDFHGEEIFTTIGSVADHYINANGQFVAGSGFSYTQKLPLPHDNDNKVVFTIHSSLTGTIRVHAYQEDDSWIEEIVSGTLTDQIHSLRLVGVIPENTSYVRVSYITNADELSLFVCEIEGTWRFKYGGNWQEIGKSGWDYEYQVNETPLTSEQLAALNSGVTAEVIDNLKNNKLDKIFTQTAYAQAYSKSASGDQSMTNISSTAQANTLALRGNNGVLKVGTPEANADATTKEYVDAGLSTKAPKFVTIPVSTCGFNTNLRENQVVEGSQLVDRIIEIASTGAKAVLKAGDFYFNITSQMTHTDPDSGAVIKAFTVDSAYLTEEDILKVVTGQQSLTANPYDETVMFLYSSTTNKTVSLYTSDVKEKVQEITDLNKDDKVKIASLKAITSYVENYVAEYGVVVDDVLVKTNSQSDYATVVENKKAKIDLSTKQDVITITFLEEDE